jgi:outer membrane lipoprotein carrier protein
MMGVVLRALRSAVAAGILAAGAAEVLPAQQQSDAAAMVGRAARTYRSLESLRADFEQIIADPMVGTFTSRGTLYQAGENQLALRFSDPAGDAIVVDGEHLWIYTPSTTPGQVIRSPVPTGGPVYGYNLLAWFLDRPAERYDSEYVRRDTVDGRPVDVLALAPLSPEMPFRSAIVWLDRADALPRRLEITERSGGTRTLILSNIRPNAAMPRDAVRFDVPSGVRVVDR